MKKLFSYIVCSLVMIVTIAMNIQQVAADLYVSDYQVTAEVQENGDVVFTEQIQFDADGSQNGVYYNLDYGGEKTPTNISVTDENGTTLQQSSSENPETYLLEDSGDYLRFKIFYPFSRERITLSIHYTIPQLIKNYNDTAEFNRVFIGGGWEIDQENILFTLHLPAAADAETLRAWAHGETDGKVTIHDDYRGVTMEAPKNQAGDKIEAHIIFPTSLTPDNPNKINEDAKERIFALEAKLAQEDVQQEEKRQLIGTVAQWGGFAGVAALVISSIMSIVNGFLGNKKRLEKVPHVPDHLFEIPEDITPAVMTYAIYLQKPDKKDVSATIMDLVRKGVLAISDTEPYELTLLEGKPIRLRSHEQFLIDFFIHQVGDGHRLVLKELETYAKDEAHSYVEAMLKFERRVRKEAEPLSVAKVVPGEPRGKSFAGCLIPVFALPIVVIATFFIPNLPLWWFIVVLIALLLAIISVAFSGTLNRRRSIDGEYRYRLWQAFRRMLVDISNLDMAEIPSIVIWDHFLVYAISLGVAKHVIKVLSKLIPEQLEQSIFYSQQYGWQMMAYHSAISSSVNRSYTSAYRSVSYSSNSSGTGGGFSGGGFSGGSGGGSGGGGF